MVGTSAFASVFTNTYRRWSNIGHELKRGKRRKKRVRWRRRARGLVACFYVKKVEPCYLCSTYWVRQPGRPLFHSSVSRVWRRYETRWLFFFWLFYFIFYVFCSPRTWPCLLSLCYENLVVLQYPPSIIKNVMVSTEIVPQIWSTYREHWDCAQSWCFCQPFQVLITLLEKARMNFQSYFIR